MEVKVLELRDRATFIPLFAISTEAISPKQRYLLRRAGFRGGFSVIVGRLEGGCPSSADPYWGDRTMTTAHIYIENNFSELKDGDVIDVEFILGETEVKKTSEQDE